MPGPAAFAEAMRALGVDDGGTVVAYDGAGIYSSARAWWMLRAMGFDRVAVLDGGLPAWVAAGRPVEERPPGYEGPRGSFAARPRAGLVVDAATVSAALSDPAAAVLDARTRERFAGTAPEPRPGLRGGHMPGAVSLPFGELQRPDGLMRPAAELRAAFGAAAGSGSGCTSAAAPGSRPACSRSARTSPGTRTSRCTTALGVSGACRPRTGRSCGGARGRLADQAGLAAPAA